MATTSTINRIILRAEPLRRAKVQPKPKGPVLENTFGKAVATPTDKRGFVTPKFRECWPASTHMVTGGMGLSARLAARLYPCFQHPAHPLRLKTQTVASESRKGALTMPQAFALVRPAAHTTQAANDAAITPTPDAIRLHMLAVNGLAEALHTLRGTDMALADIHRAIARAQRGTTALKRLAQEVAA